LKKKKKTVWVVVINQRTIRPGRGTEERGLQRDDRDQNLPQGIEARRGRKKWKSLGW